MRKQEIVTMRLFRGFSAHGATVFINTHSRSSWPEMFVAGLGWIGVWCKDRYAYSWDAKVIQDLIDREIGFYQIVFMRNSLIEIRNKCGQRMSTIDMRRWVKNNTGLCGQILWDLQNREVCRASVVTGLSLMNVKD